MVKIAAAHHAIKSSPARNERLMRVNLSPEG